MVTIDPGSPDAVLRLAQPLYGEVLRDDLPVLRARALRLQARRDRGAADVP